MAICKTIDDLTCKNCVYSVPDIKDDDGRVCVYTHLNPQRVSSDYCCGQYGEWPLICEDTSSCEAGVMSLNRANAISVMLMEG
jgi:hypothetical protein